MDNTSFISSLLILLLMIAALAVLPWLLKRWQQRMQASRLGAGGHPQVLASIAVGNGQRVVTVEVGQGAHKTCLVLGVTAQNIQCLHVFGTSASAEPESFAGAMVQAQRQDAEALHSHVNPQL